MMALLTITLACLICLSFAAVSKEVVEKLGWISTKSGEQCIADYDFSIPCLLSIDTDYGWPGKVLWSTIMFSFNYYEIIKNKSTKDLGRRFYVKNCRMTALRLGYFRHIGITWKLEVDLMTKIVLSIFGKLLCFVYDGHNLKYWHMLY